MRNRVVVALLGMAGAMAAGCGVAEQEQATKAVAPAGQILTAGMCEKVGEPERLERPDSPAGYTSRGKLRIVETDGPIPLKKGVGFGFSWRASGLPQEEKVSLVFRVAHPEITRQDGTTATQFSEDYSLDPRKAELGRIDCNFLSEDHEVVAGDWKFSVYHGDTLLVEHSFRVEKQ